MKIYHDKYRHFNTSTSASKKAPADKIAFDQSFATAKQFNHDIDRLQKKAVEDLNPHRVLGLLRMMRDADCELLGMNPREGRPEDMIWDYIPAPPVAIRPTVQQEMATTEDDLTAKLSEIIHVCSLIKTSLNQGKAIQNVMELWEHLQLQVALYIDSSNAAVARDERGRPIRSFVQRLKGKQGRFRCNLSGKRVDFSGRTVISPDPNLGVEEVAVPILIAKNLTYPETVNRYNLEKLRGRIRNGVNRWPGANYLTKNAGELKLFLKYGNLMDRASQLQIGDIVERHLEDGDIVLFNRQPSLHRLSILSHRVKVRPWRTFRLNECVCNPYNADFDGDEMNLHVPQDEAARIEATQLMGVKHNLVTPKNGEPIIAAIQDFISAAYLLSNKGVFLNRNQFVTACMSMSGETMPLDLPPPAIIKPEAFWTGKQVFNVLMRPTRNSPVLVNLDAKCREYNDNESWFHPLADGSMIIRNSEIMSGVLDKSIIGSGKKESMFFVILRDFGADEAAAAMNRMAKLCARWLTNQGFSIGIGDVWTSPKLKQLKKSLVEKAYAESNEWIARYNEHSINNASGCDSAQTMEDKISGILSKVREAAGDYCIRELSRWNTPLIMANSGSKGSKINVAQMTAVVGQQIIGSKRVEDGFQDRTLPHFAKTSRDPPAKGFVRNSFFSGLLPTEFFFHAISGREGLVDTAVKTAETGYMSRRLMKSLEDLSAQYDNTVRTSNSTVVQFRYGDDQLDPNEMEGRAKPVSFVRTFTHAKTLSGDDGEQGLLPYEIADLCKKLLRPEQKKYVRYGSDQKTILPYGDPSFSHVDQHESDRDFLQSIEDFVLSYADELSSLRSEKALSSGLTADRVRTPRLLASDNHEREVRRAVNRVAGISSDTLHAFVELCLQKFAKSQVEPASAVGAVGGQSIGEPGTQMTLKTFHFAGVAGMSITQGVPRITEIINASKSISTPVITCQLENSEDVRAARAVQARIEKTYLKDILRYIEIIWSADGASINLAIDLEGIQNLELDVSIRDIAMTIVQHPKLKIRESDLQIVGEAKIYISITEAQLIKKRGAKAAISEANEIFLRYLSVRRQLPDLVIKGYPNASRAIIQTDQNKKYAVLVEGYGLRECMTTEGVVGIKTRSNSVIEMKQTLGIEAARKTIIDEIDQVMGDMDIDPRHMQLLADIMTNKGDVLGITRHGMEKMRESVLQLASFERTADHLFNAATSMKVDRIEGVSECIIMGQTMRMGTGAFQIVHPMNVDAESLGPKRTLFEDVMKRCEV